MEAKLNSVQKCFSFLLFTVAALIFMVWEMSSFVTMVPGALPFRDYPYTHIVFWNSVKTRQ